MRRRPTLCRATTWSPTLLAVTVAALLPASLAPTARAQTLTPEDAVAMLLATSPALRAADADVRGADASVAAAEGARVPSLVVGANGQHQERFSGTGGGVVRNSNSGVVGSVAVRYTTDLGTQIEVGVDTDATWRSVNLTPGTTDAVTIGPVYAAQATLDVRQPLLRGAGDDAILSPTRQAEAARSAAERTRDQALSQLVLQTLSAYWELWYAQEAVRVQQDSLQIAERQHEDQRLRVEALHTAAPADLLQLASQRAAIQEALALAQAAQRTRAIELGRLVGVEPSSASALVAAGEPPEPTEPPPLSRLSLAATEASSELLAMRADLEALRHRVRAAADADQPRLDLTASFAVGGLWTDSTIQTLRLPGDRPAFGGLVGLELELPLGSSQAAAERAGANADLEAAEARYEAREQALQAELATLKTQVETAGRQVELAAETAALARALADAEEQRVGLGTTTMFAVVLARQSHRESELRRLRAIADRVTAELGLSHRIGQLLVVADRAEPSS